MFDSLLGGKFSNKCKHYVKCLYSRIPLIRKKKQVNVDFLKKVIADLLAHERDDNAFRRIEPLIVEINHISCYDMIEQYCEYILKQLPCLQKQRECPEDAMEAVSTLIFAAARFSDLPELSDLRQVFVERYGSHMEKSVNSEFVEKTKKSFSEDKKLQFMQSVADEFSVQWDFSSFKRRTSTAPASDQHKRQAGNNARRSLPEMNGGNAVIVERKEAAFSNGGVDYDRKKTDFSKDGTVYDRKVVVERKGAAFFVDGAIDRKKDAVFNEDAAVNGNKEGVFNGDFAINRRNNSIFNEGGEQEFSPEERSGRCNPKIFMQKQVQPEPREIHVTEKFRKIAAAAAAAEKTETLEPGYSKGSQNEGTARNRSPIEMTSPFSLEGSGNRNNILHRNEVRKDEGLNPTAQESRSIINRTNPSDAKLVNMAPPYTRPSFKNPSPPAANCDHKGSVAEERPKPVSVRSRRPQLSPDNETDNRRIENDRKAKIDLCAHHRKETADSKDHDVSHQQHVRRASSSQRRHEGGDRDEDERVMDRLLFHYSKKGMSETSKMRTRTTAPPLVNLVGERESVHHLPERVASLPLKSKSPTVESRASVGPTRATSLHPDMLSPNGGGSRQRIPDYDDLAARFMALKKA